VIGGNAVSAHMRLAERPVSDHWCFAGRDVKLRYAMRRGKDMEKTICR